MVIFTILFILLLIVMVVFVVGMIKPKLLKTKKEMTRKQIAQGFGVLIFVIFILMLITVPKTPSTQQTSSQSLPQDNSQKVTTTPVAPTPTSKPTPKPTPITYDANGFPDDAKIVTVAEIAKTPSVYENKKIVVTCLVGTFVRDSSGDAAGINCSDPNDYSSFLQINSGFDLTKINKGDTIRVYAIGNGVGKGKNAFGAEVTEPLAVGLYVNDLTNGFNNAK